MDHLTSTETIMPGDPALTPEEEAAASLGVIRHMTRTYSVGEYRYTTLRDAVAQARSVAKTAGAAA